MPAAITDPEAAASAVAVKRFWPPGCRERAAQAASARAEVDKNGYAVSATGWNRLTAGTKGQSAAAAQAAGAGRAARARR